MNINKFDSLSALNGYVDRKLNGMSLQKKFNTLVRLVETVKENILLTNENKDFDQLLNFLKSTLEIKHLTKSAPYSDETRKILSMNIQAVIENLANDNIRNLEKSGLLDVFFETYPSNSDATIYILKKEQGLFTGKGKADRQNVKYAAYLCHDLEARKAIIQNGENLEKSGLFETFSKRYPPRYESTKMLAVENFFTGQKEEDQHLLDSIPYFNDRHTGYGHYMDPAKTTNIKNLEHSGLLATFMKMYPPAKWDESYILITQDLFTGRVEDDQLTLRYLPYLRPYWRMDGKSRNAIVQNGENLRKSGLFETFSKMYPPNHESKQMLELDNFFTGIEEIDQRLLDSIAYFKGYKWYLNYLFDSHIKDNIKNLEKAGLLATFLKKYPPSEHSTNILKIEKLFTGKAKEDRITLNSLSPGSKR